MIASFALDGVAQASERGGHQKDKRHCAPNQGHPNQGNPNQTSPPPKQCHPNQGNPNQTLPDSTVG